MDHAFQSNSGHPKKVPSAGRIKIYTGEAIASLRLIRTFSRYKCDKFPVSSYNWQMDYIVRWLAFGIFPAIRENLCP
jgi:hypothetical protein